MGHSHKPIRVTFQVGDSSARFIAVIQSALGLQYVCGKNAKQLDKKLGRAICETRKVLALARQYQEI